MMPQQFQSYYQRDGPVTAAAPPAERKGRARLAWPAIFAGAFVVVFLCVAGVTMRLRNAEDLVAVDMERGVSAMVKPEERDLGHIMFQTSFNQGHLMKRMAVGANAEHLVLLRSNGHDDEAAAMPGTVDAMRSELLQKARPFVKVHPDATSPSRLRQTRPLSRAGPRRLVVSPSRKYQTIVGFGGAFTEAAALQYAKLGPDAKLVALSLYFSKAGLAYTLGRVPMNSCDFSPASYNFDNVTGDTSLSHFDDNVTHDQETMLPFILAAQAASLGSLRIFASPWSPPAWMKLPAFDKETHTYKPLSMLGSAKPRGLSTDPVIQQSWADYFVRFLRAYERFGVNLWGVTVQNEPEFAAPWEACKYNASAMRDFVGDYLGPTLKGAFPDLAIFAFDHNKDALLNWTETTFAPGSKAASYVDGMAYHWYAGSMDRNLDGTLGFDNVERSAAVLRNAEAEHMAPKMLLATEGCNCPGIARKHSAAIFRAERLAHNLIADLNSFSQGWVDWNLILDAKGGPNHLGNDCDAPMALDPKDETRLTLQPMLFYMWHLEGFVPEGSRRIHWEWSGAAPLEKGRWEESGPSGALPGMEARVGTCDGGSRQAWVFHSDGRLQVADTPPGKKLPAVCLGHKNDKPLGSALLIDCTEEVDDADKFHYHKHSGHIKSKEDDSLCLRPVDDATGDVRGVHFGSCEDSAAEWDLEEASHDGEVVFLQARDGQKCLSASWPFVSVAAFEVPNDDLVDGASPLEESSKIVVVVLNEGEADVALELDFGGERETLVSEVPAKAIQTYLLND